MNIGALGSGGIPVAFAFKSKCKIGRFWIARSGVLDIVGRISTDFHEERNSASQTQRKGSYTPE
jgi:hypothetical protein